MSAVPNFADVNKIGDRPLTEDGVTPKLGQAFDPRRNALNFWRLTLALAVIFWHSINFTGGHVPYAPLHQFLRDTWVDAFFAISGFLITASWLSKPRARNYFAARGLRILPGLWVCLIVTAFVIAPIGVAIQGGSAVALLQSRAAITYVLKNSAVLPVQLDIAGTPRGVPWSGSWNGSLWTLIFEVFCYLAVAGFGVVRLLNRRWFIPVAFGLALFWATRLPPWSVFAEQIEGHQQLDPATAGVLLQSVAARLFVMFLAGALLYRFRNVIPARWSLVALSLIIVPVTMLLPDYRLVGAIPLAYAVIASGALIRNKRLRLKTDLSYGVYIYAFPIQQVLVMAGLGSVDVFVFAIIAALATLPVAALSWFLVEKPCKHLAKPPELNDRPSDVETLTAHLR
jgi:peptidoglycan/LPS O-acetylase OafA/YrhL